MASANTSTKGVRVPRIVTTAADNATPPQTPSTPTKGDRYPASLSRVVGTRAVPRSPHRRGTSKHYETLEDLLTAAGYKETRIVTPIRARKASNSSAAESGDSDAPPANGTDGLGRRLSNFLSSWMPGASVSMGRARGAEIAREEPTRVTRQEADVGAERSEHVSLFGSRPQAGNHRIPPADFSQIRPPTTRNATKSRSPLPDFITPGGGVPFAAPRVHPAFNNPERLAASGHILKFNSGQAGVQPRLRHAATSPNLKRPLIPSKRSLTTNYIPKLGSGEREVVRGRALAVRDENAAGSSLIVPQGSRKRKSGSRSRTRSTNAAPHATLKPTSTLAPLLKTEKVVCRSTPHSRSASRVRGSQRRSMNEDIPPVPPLLSPAIVEDRLNAWLQNGGRIERPRSYASQVTSLGDADDRDNDEDDPGLGHIVFSHLSGSIRAGSTSRSSSESVPPKERTIVSPGALTSALHPYSTPSHVESTDSDHIRRQRSIRSLRAHLAPRHRRPHLLSNNAYIGRPGVPLSGRASPSHRQEEASGWLDGPEWRGAMHQPTRRNSQQPGKRGLIPWFGGERVLLQRGSGDLSLDQDE